MDLIDMNSTLENIYQLQDRINSKVDIETIKRISHNEPTSFLEGAYYGIELAMRVVAHQPIVGDADERDFKKWLRELW